MKNIDEVSITIPQLTHKFRLKVKSKDINPEKVIQLWIQVIKCSQTYIHNKDSGSGEYHISAYIEADTSGIADIAVTEMQKNPNDIIIELESLTNDDNVCVTKMYIHSKLIETYTNVDYGDCLAQVYKLKFVSPYLQIKLGKENE